MDPRNLTTWLAAGVIGWVLTGFFRVPIAFCENGPDAIPPKVKIASPTQGQHVRGVVRVEIDCSDDREVREVSVARGGALLGSAGAAPYHVDWDTRQEMEGPHRLVAKALDAAGNQGTSASITVTVDNTPPTVQITQPRRQQTVTGNVVLEAEASDIIGVAEVRFAADGIPVGSAPKPPYTVHWNSKSISNGVHVLEARALDLAGNSTTSEPTEIRVANPNKPPLLSSVGPKSVLEGETLEFRLSATDPDGARDAITYKVADPPKWVRLDSRTGEVRASPDRAAATTEEPQKIYTLRFQACDPEPFCTSIEVPITVSNVNSAPQLRPIADVSVREGEYVAIPLDAASDPDGDALMYSTGPLPAWLQFEQGSRTLSGTPDFDVANLEEETVPHPMTVKVSDPDGLADEKNFTVSVVNKNRPPVWTRISDKTIPEGRTFAFTVEAVDPDEEIPVLSASPLPAGAMFQDNRDGTGTFLWASRLDQAGTYKIVFSAHDGQLKDTQTVAVKLDEASLSLSGKIIDPLDQGFPGATVQLTTAGQPVTRVTTNAEGYFIVSGLRSGSYTIKPFYEPSEEFSTEARTSLGYHFSPLSQRVTIDRADQTDVRFTALPD